MIHASNITKQYGSNILFKGASFQIRPGDKIGLVGPNGAGKTTVFRLITGEEGVDQGEVNVPEKLILGYFSQEVGEMHGRSALEEVMEGAGRVSLVASELKKIEDALQTCTDEKKMSALLELYGGFQIEFEQRGGYDLESRAEAILTGLGIVPRDHQKPVESFSGGWRMRIQLARILALNPDVLLMDEPTNYLDVESIVWLEEWLVQFRGSLMMTSHDRDFMNRIVKRIVEVANQSITTYSGNYDFYEKESAIRLEQLISSHARQQQMLAKEEEFIARFAARASHAAQVQSRVKKIEKIERIEIPSEQRTIRFEFPPPPRSGNDVVRLRDLSKSWSFDDGTEHPVFSHADAMVKRLDRIALTGVNGAGKSTLLKIICGMTEPSTGEMVLGAGVRLGYFSQYSLDVLNPDKTIYDEIFDRVPMSTVGFVRNLLGAFLFSGDDVYKKISVLSGGEKSRVVLASLLANPVNFLVLDEPTNHLDIKSREILLDAVKKFEGTVMIVSHDRYFLRSIATRVFELDRGEMHIYEGNYEYYVSASQKWKKA